LTLEADVQADVPDILTDREALRRVVCSLVENAIKYTPDGGRITIKAGAAREAGGVEITVKDTGVGILSEDVPLVFEKFFRGRPAPSASGLPDAPDGSSDYGEVPGVGLGLYLAHRIVGQLGGSITVQSPPQGENTGTAFTVRLPVWDGDGSEEEAEEKTNVEAFTGS
jgi:signal transduction histidine kinase